MEYSNPHAQALAVVEFGPEGPYDFPDLSSYDKIALRGSDGQETDLVVDPDCVTAPDASVDNPKGPGLRQNMQQSKEAAKGGRGQVSSRSLPRCPKAVLFVLFVSSFPMKAGGDGAIPNPTPVNITETVGNKVNLLSRCKCPSDLCRLDFYHQIEGRYKTIWEGKECVGSSGCMVDAAGNPWCIASINTAGNYHLIDFHTDQTVCSIGLTVQTAEPLESEATSNNWPNGLYSSAQATEPVRSGATSNSFPVGLLVACTIYVLDYFICQR